MVQISTAIVAAAIAAPVLAAPFGGGRPGFAAHPRDDELEARKFHISLDTLKKVGTIAKAAGKAAKTGVEFGATVGSVIPPREYEDLETRKFHISSKTAGRIAKGVAGAAGFAGTAAVAATQNQAQTAQAREFEDIEERKFHISSKTAGTIAKGVAGAAGFAGTAALAASQPQAREFDVVEIDAREPRFGGHGPVVHSGPLHAAREFSDDMEVDARDPSIFGKIFKGAAKVAGSFLREDEEEEMLAREPRFGGHAHGGHRHGPPAAAPPAEREFSDEMEVDARDPFSFGKILKGAAKVAGSFLREDEEEEMLAREPRFGGHGREYSDDMEVDARDPFSFGKILKGAAKVAGSFLREDEEEEMLAREPRFGGHAHGGPRHAAPPAEREFSDEMEVDARDPFSFGKILKGAAKVAGSFIREEDEDELLAREYESEYDELD